MKTVIIDDEKPAISILTKFVSKVPFLQLSLASTNAFDALELINDKHVDLLFLDIEMPDITGLEFLASLEYRPLVIITTAYEQYALKGYEWDVVDYLVKPIRFERFLKAVNKAQHRGQTKQANQQSLLDNSLFIKVDYKTVRIKFDDILFIEGLKDYVKIYTRNHMYLTRLNLKGIYEKLPASQFVRIHRSYIASLSKINSFQKNQLSIGTKTLPIGEVFATNLFDKLG